MSKIELITWLAALPESDPKLEMVDNVRRSETSGITGENMTITIAEAAKRSGVGRSTIYRAITAKALSPIYLYEGSRPRILMSDFRQWIGNRSEKHE